MNPDALRSIRDDVAALLERIERMIEPKPEPAYEPEPRVTVEPRAGIPTRVRSLSDLLGDLFGVPELRRFLRYEVGEEFVRDLPQGTVALRELAFETQVRLDRQGITSLPSFWAALLKERPRRRSHIAPFAKHYGVELP